MTQGAVKQMLAQKSGGSVVSITTSLAVNPIAGVSASVPMITKGGLEAVSSSLATEYAKQTFALQRCRSWRRGYSPSQEQSQRIF